jgi:molybdate transport system substrate-binding protein
MKAHKSLLSLVLARCFGATPTRAREIAVAAAADLKFAASEVAGQYEKQTGNKVNVTYGSSGNFFSQLQNGAPFDLFFSADIDYARKLETAGLAEPVTRYRYAIGRIVIWAPADSKVDCDSNAGWQTQGHSGRYASADRAGRNCARER